MSYLRHRKMRKLCGSTLFSGYASKIYSEGIWMKTKMILQIHDELIFEVPEEEIEAVKTLVLKKMEEAFPLSVPIVVDCGIGNSWFEAH